ncbi:MAG: insulinase family protein [Bacteroidales bacterium]|nr:insulinase family protein [Bacteroidales bacterium]
MKKILTLFLFIALAGMIHAQQSLKVETFRLDNGLKVILCEEHSQPKIYGCVVVHAGSKNENPNATGVAHYFEHIMFKGTDRIGTTDWAKEKPYLDSISQAYDRLQAAKNDKERHDIQLEINRLSIAASQYAIPNEVDAILQNMGCTGLNAGTSYDYTVYYNTLPSNQLINWMDVYVERFRNPVFRLFQSELETIYEEKNRSDNKLAQKFAQNVLSESYGDHPYGRQVIGYAKHLKNPQPSEMQKFFDTYYVANNMTLILVGDFNSAEVKGLVRDKFSVWRSGKLPEMPAYNLPDFAKQKVLNVRQTPIKMGMMIFPGVPKNHPDKLALDMLSQILGGNTGLLTQAAIDGRFLLALNMDVSLNDAGTNTILYIPNLLFQSHAKAEQVVWDCIDSIKQGQFSDDIMEGIKVQSYIDRQHQIESISKISALLLSLETEGSSYEQWLKDGKRWSSLTREDVMAVANKYFDRDHCTLVRSKMGFPSGEPAVKPDWEHLEPTNKGAQSPFAKIIANNQPEPIKPQVIDFKKDLDIQPVNPHFNLYSTQNPYNDIFNLEITYNYGIIDNPDIQRAISYMELLGADSLKYQELQQQLNLLGATVSLVSDEDRSSLTISGLESNLDSILSLCQHWLYHPHHDARQLEKILDGLKSNEKSMKNDADSWSSALSEYVFYGNQSQYLRETPYKQWGKRTGEELHAEVLQILTRNGYVTFSGNTDPSTLANKLRHYCLVRDSVTDMRPREFRRKDYTTPQFFYATNKKFLQSNIDIYVPSIYLDTNLFTPDGSPCDRAAGSIFTEYFGSGMNSVMFQEIREFRSLGYSTRAYVASSLLRLNPLYTYAYLGTQCDKTQEGVEAIRDLLVTFPERPEKIQSTIQNVVSSRNSNYLTFRRIPEMVQYWKEDLGWHRDFRADLTEQMSRLTIDDLRAFHTKYIKNRPLVVVISGNAKKFDPQAVANLLGSNVKPIKVDFDQMFQF